MNSCEATHTFLFPTNKIHPLEKKLLVSFIICLWAPDCINNHSLPPSPSSRTQQVPKSCRGSPAATFYKATITATQLVWFIQVLLHRIKVHSRAKIKQYMHRITIYSPFKCPFHFLMCTELYHSDEFISKGARSHLETQQKTWLIWRGWEENWVMEGTGLQRVGDF